MPQSAFTREVGEIPCRSHEAGLARQESGMIRGHNVLRGFRDQINARTHVLCNGARPKTWRWMMQTGRRSPLVFLPLRVVAKFLVPSSLRICKHVVSQCFFLEGVGPTSRGGTPETRVSRNHVNNGLSPANNHAPFGKKGLRSEPPETSHIPVHRPTSPT